MRMAEDGGTRKRPETKWVDARSCGWSRFISSPIEPIGPICSMRSERGGRLSLIRRPVAAQLGQCCARTARAHSPPCLARRATRSSSCRPMMRGAGAPADGSGVAAKNAWSRGSEPGGSSDRQAYSARRVGSVGPWSSKSIVALPQTRLCGVACRTAPITVMSAWTCRAMSRMAGRTPPRRVGRVGNPHARHGARAEAPTRRPTGRGGTPCRR